MVLQIRISRRRSIRENKLLFFKRVCRILQNFIHYIVKSTYALIHNSISRLKTLRVLSRQAVLAATPLA